MQKLIIIVVASVLVIGGAVLSVQHYENYKNLKLHADQVAAQKATAAANLAKQTEAAKEAQLVADYNRVVVECQKGVTLYNALAPATKAKTSAIVCK